jgi:transposase-like protein
MSLPKSKEIITNPTLIAGEDYPLTYREFVTMFPDDNSCIDYLTKLRWENGFVCIKCKKASKPWSQTHNRLTCPYCHYQTTVTAGTIFDKTRTPLTTWLEAAWHLTTAKNGMSAKTIEKTLGISYRVAWTMLQRFRVAMVRTQRGKLSGKVEIDEILVGGVDKGGKRGRGSKKNIVVIAVELLEPKGFGRVRMRFIPDASSKSLTNFINDVVEPNSIVCTDGWASYNNVESLGYTHEVTVVSTSEDQAHVSMPGVHQVAALLKRWILGTHQGSISDEHLQSYLEEYTFRFNRRKSKNRGLIFRRLLEQAVCTHPVTDFDVTNGYDWDNMGKRS